MQVIQSVMGIYAPFTTPKNDQCALGKTHIPTLFPQPLEPKHHHKPMPQPAQFRHVMQMITNKAHLSYLKFYFYPIHEIP